MQELVELVGSDAEHRFLLVDHAFFHHIHRNPDSRRTRALSVPGLQHVQRAIFNGELEVLHITVMLFETRGYFAELVVRRGHHFLEFGDRLRRANAGHHIFSLGVHQELAVEDLFTRGQDCA